LCQSDALEGAINNLIDNALNANAKKIYLNVVTKNDDTMVFNVLDDGDGMDEATLQKVMRPFYTTRAKGTGLGLAVVDAVVKAHQGQMKIISKVGVGSTFSIQIPLIHENVQKEPQ
jgi:two-component system sensor histidine kinase FlrB